MEQGGSYRIGTSFYTGPLEGSWRCGTDPSGSRYPYRPLGPPDLVLQSTGEPTTNLVVGTYHNK